MMPNPRTKRIPLAYEPFDSDAGTTVASTLVAMLRGNGP